MSDGIFNNPAFGPEPTHLGANTVIAAANGVPSGAAAGFTTNALRFINLIMHLQGGAGATASVNVWVYHSQFGWFLYTDVPTTTLLLANNGGIFQLELRGLERVYLQVNSITAGATLTVRCEGVTY